MVTAVVLAALAVMQVSPAGAAPSEIGTFPESPAGTGTGQLLRPGAVAASAATGDVYVADSGNARISQYTSGGDFVRSWGWGVVASGPHNDPHNEQQEVALTATGGDFRLAFRDPLAEGEYFESGPIPFSATAGEVRVALEDLPPLAAGDIATNGPAGGPWSVEFISNYADTDVAPLEADTSNLIGTAQVETLHNGGSFEICEPVVGDVCRAGQAAGGEPGEIFGVIRGIAVDAVGSVYVLEQQTEGPSRNSRVEKFGPGGAFELMLGGEVNKSDGSNRCTKVDLENGDLCGAGAAGHGPGEFEVPFVGGLDSRLAIDVGEKLLVGDEDRVERFQADGSFDGELATDGFVRGIASDAAGSIYLSFFEKSNVTKLASDGTAGTPGSFIISNPRALAVDVNGNLFAVQDPAGFGTPTLEPRVVEFDPAGNLLVPNSEEQATNQFFAQKGTLSLNGLAGLRCEGGIGLGALYVSDQGGHVSTYGADPECEGGRPPVIVGRFVRSASSESATIATQINPRKSATTYLVEYGPEPCATSSCAQEPTGLGKSLEDEGSSPVLREVNIDGLAPGTTYYYRVVVNAASGTSESKEGTFTTRKPGTGPLPDDRAFEMVSPSQKNSGDIAPQGGLANFLMQAAESDPKLVYPSSTPFAEPESAPPLGAYLGTRLNAGSEWAVKNISPQGAALAQQVKALSKDLSTAAVVSSEPPLCCGAANGISNLYLRDLATGAYQLITTEEPQLSVPKTDYCVGIQGFTPDFSRVFFKANGALTDNSPVGSGWNLYEWTKAGGIRLTSVLPGGTPATPGATTNFGFPYLNCEAERIVEGAISEDGTRAIWSSGSALYARINGNETVQLDLPQGGSGPAGTGTFWAASKDAKKVFFTASSPLTDGAHSADLYRYDFDQPLGGRLADLTTSSNAAEVEGVVGASQTGDAVYFVAKGVLAANEGPAIDPMTGTPETAKAGQNNLYLWTEDDGARFIARLSPNLNTGDPHSDAGNWEAAPSARTAAVTADANILALTSVEPLTGYENEAQGSEDPTRQVYLYDAREDDLVCVSCNPTGARPLGGAATTAWKTAFVQPRFLSTDGNRIFFESFDDLVAEDQDDARDVYQFERADVGDCSTSSPTYWGTIDGCLDLISDASAGSGASFFLDASADGRETFISTAGQLAGIDQDEKYDAYDVRVAGVSQLEALPPPACGENECRSSLPLPPPFAEPASNPPLGQGDVLACPKGKTRKGSRCIRKPCRKGRVRRKGRCIAKRTHNQQKHHAFVPRSVG